MVNRSLKGTKKTLNIFLVTSPISEENIIFSCLHFTPSHKQMCLFMFCSMVYLNNTKLTHLFVRRYFQLCWVRRVPLQDFVFLLSPWMFSRTPSGLMQGHFRIVQWFIYNHSWVLLAVSPCLALTVLGCCPVGPMTCIWGRAFWHWAACFPPESLDTFDFSLCSAHARKQTQTKQPGLFWLLE